jgi:hypothetical protein
MAMGVLLLVKIVNYKPITWVSTVRQAGKKQVRDLNLEDGHGRIYINNK